MAHSSHQRQNARTCETWGDSGANLAVQTTRKVKIAILPASRWSDSASFACLSKIAGFYFWPVFAWTKPWNANVSITSANLHVAVEDDGVGELFWF